MVVHIQNLVAISPPFWTSCTGRVVQANLRKHTASAVALLCLMLIGCDNSPTPTEKSQPVPAEAAISADDDQDRTASSFRALKLLEGSKMDQAWEECQRVLLAAPSDTRALYVAACVLHDRKKLDQALQMIDRIPIADPEFGLVAHRDAVNWTNMATRLLDAETRAVQLLKTYPNDVDTTRMLAALLDLQGRRFESSKWMQRMVRLGNVDISTLVLAVDTVKPVNSDPIVDKLLKEHPEAVRLKGSLAFGLLYEQKPEEAESLFREMILEPNASPSSFIGLGLSLLEQERYEALPAWLASVPRPGADQLPAFWRVLGSWYQIEQAYPEAIYCLSRSIALDPMDYLALGPLAQCLLANGQKEDAALAEAMFQRMQLANRNINYARDGFRKPEWMFQIADALTLVGRQVESLAWRELCERANDGDSKTLARLQTERRALASQMGSNASTWELPWAVSMDKPPDLEILATEIRSASSTITASESGGSKAGGVSAQLRWNEVAADLGANFRYDNGDDPSIVGMQTYQSNGGGAGCIDFDRNGWPDLYALQAGGDPRQPASNAPCALFRNLSGTGMVDVAAKAHVTNRAYGQGVAVGDWDQDGFPDLWILNFGENRLLRNMGDGTFAQVDVPAMRRDVLQDPVWSVSGAIADLNGDHLPDLIEINYSAGIDVITHQCFSQQKVLQVCRPTEFPASKDYVYLSDGSGGFTIANDLWNLTLDDGRGLGLIVGNLDRQHGNDVFIANDMSPNNLLMSSPNPLGENAFLLSDEAVRRGCAVDVQGKPQASMGVGCADVDRNGTLDLFMTNFIDEYNALYLQSDTHFYQDASRRYRLIDPKKKTLGFGTQLQDLDLDGWQDIFIVNGHVDDYRALGQPYEMRPQVFLQRDGAFQEQDSLRMGDFFQREFLSRSLGVWDFDRDGRPDWYITHLDQPLSILHNASSSSGHWLMIELVGIDSERDAIGATIRLRAGEEVWVHQRLAGNGFECSNEPWIHFGLGNAITVDSIEIDWPSGKTTQIRNVQADRRYRVLEGLDALQEELLGTANR